MIGKMTMQASERDIQHLRVAASLTRAQAVHSLAQTSGDVHRALENELSSYHLNQALLTSMLQEYAMYRQGNGPLTIMSCTDMCMLVSCLDVLGACHVNITMTNTGLPDRSTPSCLVPMPFLLCLIRALPLFAGGHACMLLHA